jgi:hypothetical protein
VGEVKRKSRKPPPVIGWREWVALPDLGIERIKAKIDTGARSSAIHAFNLKRFERDGVRWVRFAIHPHQRTARGEVVVEAPVLEYRRVRSSGGHETNRPVIETTVSWCGLEWKVELTLAARDAMGFRMLLGRQAIRGRMVVDPGESFLGDQRP